VKKRGECKIAVPDETVTLVEDRTPKAELIISLDELGVSKSKSKLNDAAPGAEAYCII
jgi:hypothetical protein